MKGVAHEQQNSQRASSSAQGGRFGVGRGQEVAKNEAANAVWGQMVKGLGRFAIKFELYAVSNGEPWKVLKGMMLFEKDNSATV